MLRRTNWQVEHAALPAADRQAFRSMAELLAQPMERITLDRRSGVSRLRLAGTYYVKRFAGRGSRLKHLLGISRYRRELHNLRLFRRLGLQTPVLVAAGQETLIGMLQQGVLVTAEVSGAVDLEQALAEGALYRDGAKGARAVLRELALAARRLHADRFHHRDLKARNILLRWDDTRPELFFFDCPSGHHPPGFLLHRAVVRDLAHLEEGLRGRVRRADLLYLFKQYRGCKRLSAGDRALLRDVMAYRARHR